MNDGLPRMRLIGYSDRMSVRPGESLRFMVSCEEVSTYHAEIVRLERFPSELNRGFPWPAERWSLGM